MAVAKSQTLRWFVLAGLLVGCSSTQDSLAPKSSDALRIGSYNVHYIVDWDDSDWGLPNWEQRKGALAQAIEELDADIIAFQEMETWGGSDDDSNNRARPFLLAKFPRYKAAAIGPWQQFPSTQPIFYRHQALQLVDQGFFMFGPEPDIPYSPTYDGDWSAFASWAWFERKSDRQRFRVVNIHTDYASRSNRLKSMALVNQRIQAWLDEPLFVVGDFNALHGLRELTTLADITFPSLRATTYHLNRGWHLLPAIDHLGHRNATLIDGPVVYQREFEGRYGSDHYPVVSDYRFED